MATTSSDKTVKLWGLPELDEIRVLEGHSRWVWDCSYSEDSIYIVTGNGCQRMKQSNYFVASSDNSANMGSERIVEHNLSAIG